MANKAVSRSRGRGSRFEERERLLAEQKANNQYAILAEKLRYSIGFLGFVAIERRLSDLEVTSLAEDIAQNLIGNSSPLIVAVDRQRGIRQTTYLADSVCSQLNQIIDHRDGRGPALSKRHKLFYADLPPDYSVFASILAAGSEYVASECTLRGVDSAHLYTPVLLVPRMYTEQLGLNHQAESSGQLHMLKAVGSYRSKGLIWSNLASQSAIND